MNLTNARALSSLLGLACVTLADSQAVAQVGDSTLLAYDGFAYPTKPDLNGSNGGSGWVGAWIDTGSTLLTGVANPGLAWPNLPTTGGTSRTADWTAVDYSYYDRAITPYVAPAGKVYISCLIRPEAGMGGWHVLHVGGKYPKALSFGNPLGSYLWGMMLSEGFMSLSNVPVIQGQTAFLVLEITWTPTLTTYELFVNPAAGQPRPAFSNATMGVAGNALPTGIHLFSDGGYSTDELRIGTTWASVTGGIDCYADCDKSGTLTIDDFICFQTTFAIGDPAADCDGDGVLSIDDFICFQTMFAIGC